MAGTESQDIIETLVASDRGPFESLFENGEVQRLFEQYPRLRYQLHQVYQSTLEPDPLSLASRPRMRGSSNRGRGRGGSSSGLADPRRWTPEKGFNRGLYCIRSQQQPESRDANGLEALTALVSKLCPPERSNETSTTSDVFRGT